EDAETQDEAASHPSRGQEDVLLCLNLPGQTRVDPLQLDFVLDACGVPPERHDAERRGRHELELRRGGDLTLGVEREVEAGVDGFAESCDPEVPQGDPELERTAAARELKPEVGEVHLLVRGLDVREEIGRDLEAAP